MYKNVLEGIDNIAIWPVISFVIFILFFICLLWYVFTVNTDFILRMKNLPMDDQDNSAKQDRGAHHDQNSAKPTRLKKWILLPVLLLGSVGTWAQDTSAKSLADPMQAVYLIMALLVIAIVLTIAVAIVAFRAVNVLIQKAEEAKAKTLGVKYVAPQSAWEKLWQSANAMVPLEEEKNIELDHNFDGIRELDNHLPPWWTGLFYGSVVFAVVYMILYHFSATMPSSAQEYEGELADAAEQVRILRASQPAEVIDLNTLAFTRDEAVISRGKKLFASNNCGSCHRNDGGGNTIGPNLTDEYWIHGGEIKNVFSTVNNGVIEKAMPAWGKVMSQKDVRDLAFYVMSLQGSNPENPKKPQGELYKLPEPAAPDSTKISMKK